MDIQEMYYLNKGKDIVVFTVFRCKTRVEVTYYTNGDWKLQSTQEDSIKDAREKYKHLLNEGYVLDQKHHSK